MSYSDAQDIAALLIITVRKNPAAPTKPFATVTRNERPTSAWSLTKSVEC